MLIKWPETAPALIVNSAAGRPRVRLHNGLLVFHQPGTSMANQKIMEQWLKVYFNRSSTPLPTSASRPTLLIMDSFRAHLTETMRSACRQANVRQAIIPGGMTIFLQPLDLVVNKSFKCLLKRWYHQNSQAVLSGYDRAVHRSKQNFSIDVFTKACHYAWNLVSPSIIRSGFRMMCRNAGNAVAP